MKLMGGHQIIAGIRPETDKPIEVSHLHRQHG